MRIIAVDNFYRDPDAVRKRAFDYTFVQPEHITGYRSRRGYFPPRLKQKIERLTGYRVKSLDRPEGSPYDNGVFFQSFASGRRKEVPGVHFDDPVNGIVCIVYLTPGIPAHCGTSFYRHKKTGLESAPDARLARKMRRSLPRLLSEFEDDSRKRSKWVEVDRVGYKYNRAVFFPAKRFHAATNHYGGSLKDGRIYQLFTFLAN